MAEYQYRMITPEGKEKKGTIEANSAQQVQMSLKAQNNIVLEVQEVNLLNKDINIGVGARVTTRDFSIFCRQFSSIIGAGVSIFGALDMIREQTENKKLKTGLQSVYDDVSKGEQLSSAMRKKDKIFPSLLCNMISAGEATGNVENAFQRMAIQFEKDNKLKQSVKKAMIYPIVLLLVMVGVITIMMVGVIPNFVGMFEELGTNLPMSTQLVIGISNFFLEKWWLMLLVIAGVIFAGKLFGTSGRGKMTYGMIKLRLPVFGKLQTKSECARFGRTMCTLTGAGIPMMNALEITAKAVENIHYRKALLDAKDQVLLGIPLSKALKSTGLFPPMVIHMISIGEQTGNMEVMLENIADYYEEDVRFATEQIMALIEPALIIVMAVIVGGLVIAIMQPMMELYSTLG